MSKFTDLAPRIMRDLQRDIPAWGVLDAAAAVGNAGHESAGMTKMQEIKPTVKGSRGGYGWYQWTGPRRRAYEAWCRARKLDVASYEANYGYLIVELRGSERAAVKAVADADGIEAKVQAFEERFERAGVKHYPSRIDYARQALKAYQAVYPDGKEGAAPAGLTDDKTVRYVQGRLNDLGYQAGEVDGIMGTKTRAAILGFRADQVPALPTVAVIDQELLAALVVAEPRPVAVERATATPADLAAKGSPTVQSGFSLRKIAAWLGFGAAGGATDQTGLLDQARTGLDKVDAVKDVGGRLIDAVQWCLHHWWIFAAIAAYLVFSGAGEVIWSKVREYRAGAPARVS